jgi:putative peptide zinc metalloprotease protein
VLPKADTLPPPAPPGDEDGLRATARDGAAPDGNGAGEADTVVKPPDEAQAQDGAGAQAAAAAPPPKLSEGIELVGEFQDSGFKEAPYIARRQDGQTIQLPQLLYIVAEEVDGQRDYAQLAEAVSERFGRGVSAENIQVLVDEKLRPLGVLAQADGSSPELEKVDPMLALKFRAALIPEGVVNAITTIFKPLFLPPIVLAVLGGLVAVDVWVFFLHGVAQSTRSVLYQPVNMLILLGLVALSAAFHECGHATACRYGGARPGVMGAGLYIVWPAFYTDVTDAYRLGKGGRLRTDLGGVYFNVIFILATAGAYVLTGFEPLLLIIPLQHIEIIHQFLPFLRLDGYYIVSDLTGVPDMFARIKPTLKSLLPWRKADPLVTELKPWVRVATTIYVFTVVPFLIFAFGLMAMNAPRIFATAYDSFFVQWDKVQANFSDGSVFAGAFGVFQMLVLVLPALGIVVTFWKLGTKIATGSWNKTEGRPLARVALVTAASAGAAFVAYIWWPNGEYKPIQPGERGTIQGAVKEIAAVPSGRPALTPQQEQKLGGAPTKRARTAPTGQEEPQRTTTVTRTATTQTTTTVAQTSTQPAATTTAPATTQTTATVTTPVTTATTP